jgi:hypothetical protein
VHWHPGEDAYDPILQSTQDEEEEEEAEEEEEEDDDEEEEEDEEDEEEDVPTYKKNDEFWLAIAGGRNVPCRHVNWLLVPSQTRFGSSHSVQDVRWMSVKCPSGQTWHRPFPVVSPL